MIKSFQLIKHFQIESPKDSKLIIKYIYNFIINYQIIINIIF
jgi:hypothetical protein